MIDRNLFSMILVLIVVTLISCNEANNGSNQLDGEIIIENIKLFDENGSPKGCYPLCDLDWTNFDIGNVQARESLETSAGVSNSTEDIDGIVVYPNPYIDVQNIIVLSSLEYNLSIAVVDKNSNIVLQRSTRVQKDFPISINYAELGISPNTLYRMYYRISNANKVTIYEGYGDILGCMNTIDFIDCYSS